VAQPVAIICAMQWELAHAVASLSAVPDGNCVFHAELQGQPIVLEYCGMGMVNAAAGAAFAIARYQPRAVLNYGCAGAHRPDLLLGDIVVGSRLVAYDNVRESPEGEVRYRGMPLLVSGKQQLVEALDADASLLEAAANVSAHQVEAWPANLGWPSDVQHRAPRVVFGTVTSADRWNRSVSSIRRLVDLHESLCEDMEAAAIAQVCATYGVPFLTIKDISNNELLRATKGGQAMLDELGEQQVARRAARFTLDVVLGLSSKSNSEVTARHSGRWRFLRNCRR
jgi:adenosylhomocysteine nucleosidase